jgi:hypothetical protein
VLGGLDGGGLPIVSSSVIGCRGLSSDQSSARSVGKVHGFSLRGSVGVIEGNHGSLLSGLMVMVVDLRHIHVHGCSSFLVSGGLIPFVDPGWAGLLGNPSAHGLG